MHNPEDLRTEIYVNGQWVEISSDVRGGGGGEGKGITIKRGRKNEHSRVAPTSCDLTLEDFTGKYNPFNPRSEYYGLIGENTPLRHGGSGTELSDNFNRSVSDAWTGGSFTWTNSGGIAANYDINGTHGTQTHTDTNVLRNSTASAGQPDMRVRATFKLSAATVTGASATLRVMGRVTDTSNYYFAEVTYTTAGDVQIGIKKRVAGVDSVVAAAISTHAGYGGLLATYQFTCELYVAGSRLHARLWDSSNHDEPLPYNLSATDTSLTTGNSCGVASRRETSNTNTDLQFQYDTFLTVPGTFECHVEIPNFGALRWTEGGHDITMAIQGRGVKSRLGTSASVLRSPLYRAHKGQGPLAWWPMEDEPDSNQAASGVPGQPPLAAVGKPSNWNLADNASGVTVFGVPTAVGSASLVGLQNGGFLRGSIPPSTETEWSLEFVMRYDSGTDAGLDTFPVDVRGGLWEWLVAYSGSTNEIVVRGGTIAGVIGVDFAVAFEVYDGVLHHYRLDVIQNGANVDHFLYIDGTFMGSDTWVSFTNIVPTTALVNVARASGTDQPSLAHYAIYAPTPATSITDSTLATTGHQDETAGERFERLCTQEGIAYEVIGTAADTARMGPQRIATLLQNLEDCEDADGGIVYEPKHFLGLSYITAASIYNQTGPDFAYTDNYLSGEPYPDPESLVRANDVTASRINGSSFRAVETSGPASIEDAPNGMGHYPKNVPLNVAGDGQLPDMVTWVKHISTWLGPRYPTIKFELHRSVFANSVAATAQVENIDIGRYFSISDLPIWLPPEAIEQLAQGYTKIITNRTREITFNAVPAGPYDVAIRGSSYLDGRIRDSYSSVLAEALDTTETGVDVTVVGPLWVTGSVDFSIMINGELMDVSSIAGASSPQTLTVTRSVNGIVKTHAIGDAVHVYPLARRAVSGPDANLAYTPGSGRTVRGLDTPRSGGFIELAVSSGSGTGYAGESAPLGVTFVAPTTGAVMIHIACNLGNDTAGAETYMSYEIREGASLGIGTVFAGAVDRRAVMSTGTDNLDIGVPFLGTGFTPGKLYNIVLQRRVSAGTGTWSRRILIVKPAGGDGGLSGTPIQGETASTRDLQDASDTSTSTSYTTADMTSCGVSFVAPSSGKVYVHVASRIDNSAGNSTYVSYRIGTGSTVGAGSSVVAADDSRSLENFNTNQVRLGATFTVTGLTGGDTYNVQLLHRVTGGTGTLEGRHVAIEPIV